MNLQLICRSWCYQPFKKCWYVCCGQQNHDLTMRLSKRIDRVRYNQMQTSPIASDTSTRLHVLIPSLIYRRKLGNCFMAIVLSDDFLWDAEHVAVARSSRDCTIGPPLRLNLKHTKTSKNECPNWVSSNYHKLRTDTISGGLEDALPHLLASHNAKMYTEVSKSRMLIKEKGIYLHAPRYHDAVSTFHKTCFIIQSFVS
jgi:hypothetical protein